MTIFQVFQCYLFTQMWTDVDYEGNTALHLAVENGHYEVVKICLEKSECKCGLAGNETGLRRRGKLD